MAQYNTHEALELLLENSFQELDSGDEDDINEDPSFPLPIHQESGQSEESESESEYDGKKQ